MNCREFEEHLVRYCYEAAGGERGRIAAHLGRCPSCRRKLAELRAVRRLADQVKVPPVSAGEWVEFTVKIREQVATRPARSWALGRLVLRPILVAAAAIAAVSIIRMLPPIDWEKTARKPASSWKLAAGEGLAARRDWAAAQKRPTGLNAVVSPEKVSPAAPSSAVEMKVAAARVTETPPAMAGSIEPLDGAHPLPAAANAAALAAAPAGVAGRGREEGGKEGTPPGGEDVVDRPQPTATGTPAAPRVVLKNNVFNPLNGGKVTVVYSLAAAGRVRLVIYNSMGELVAVPFAGERVAGEHEDNWDGINRAGAIVSAGIYFISLETPGYSERRKVVVIK